MLSFSKNFSKNLSAILLSSKKQSLELSARQFSLNLTRFCAAKENSEENSTEENEEPKKLTEKQLLIDRTKVIPVETSIKYLKSSSYQKTYGETLVWEQYRRNHKGALPPRKTRKTCIRKGKLSTGNPCPICRDEYLVLHAENTDLLKQFISPRTGEIISYSKTGLCQQKHFDLQVAVERARDAGLLTFDVPFREYDYSEYYGKELLNKSN